MLNTQTIHIYTQTHSGSSSLPESYKSRLFYYTVYFLPKRFSESFCLAAIEKDHELEVTALLPLYCKTRDWKIQIKLENKAVLINLNHYPVFFSVYCLKCFQKHIFVFRLLRFNIVCGQLADLLFPVSKCMTSQNQVVGYPSGDVFIGLVWHSA